MYMCIYLDYTYVPINIYTQAHCKLHCTKTLLTVWIVQLFHHRSKNAGLGLTKAIALAASYSNTSGWGSLVSWRASMDR